MIDCPDYLGGDWKQKLQFIFPPHMYKKNGGCYTEKDSCCIDICIAEEILYLWKRRMYLWLLLRSWNRLWFCRCDRRTHT